MAFPLDGLLTVDDVKCMNPQEINDNWERVSEALSANRTQQSVDADADGPEDPAPRRTGGWTPLTREMLPHLSEAEINARWSEVSRLLESGR